MASLRVLSLNVNGLRNNVKRKTLFRNFKEQHLDVICLQESYITKNVACEWEKEWGGKLVFVEGTARSKGQLILLRKSLPYEVQVVHTHERLLVVKLKLGVKDVCICNAYGPNSVNEIRDFLSETATTVGTLECDNVIVCGDFNTVLHNDLDIISGDKHNVAVIESFHSFTDACQLSDAWRVFNDNLKEFTWSRIVKGKLIARRLDYILVTDSVINDVTECNITSFPQSDHRGVYIVYKFCDCERGPSYWKLNNSLLKEQEYLHMINKVIETFNLDDTQADMSDDMRWEMLKLQMKEETIQYSKQRAIKRKNCLIKIKAQLELCESQLAKEPFKAATLHEREKLLVQLELLEQEKTRSAQTRAKVKWIEEGDKNTKFFLNLEKSRASSKLIPSLELEDGTKIYDQFEIFNVQKKHFQSLYHQDTVSSEDVTEELDIFLQDCPTPLLTDEEMKSCEGKITEEEAAKALKEMNNGSSPGLDGFTTEFYKVFWAKLRQPLLRSFSSSFEKGSLCFSQCSAVITLIHKGKELSKDKLTNWRPISLTNTDYKLLAKCLASRLNGVISSVVNEDQVGYIRGRSIATNLRLIDDVIDYLKLKNKPGVLLALDFTKAFDCISKKFMIAALKRFGFGQEFVKWVSVLMTNTKSRIGYNGWISDVFDVNRGIRQGCPLSPLVFIIGLEMMAIKVRSTKDIKGINIENCMNDNYLQKVIKTLLYADDMTLFLQSKNDVRLVLDALDSFKKVSGLYINRKKSEAMWLGANKTNDMTGFGLIWVSEIKVLGILFSNNYSASEIDKNWTEKIKVIKSIILQWEKRNLSLLGKICVIKSYLVSQLIHVMRVISLPEKVLTEINTILYRFLWKKKTSNTKAFEKVKRQILINNYSKGGLNMIDMHILQQSFNCEWLVKLSKASAESKWCWIPRLYFLVFGKDLSILNSATFFKKFKGFMEVPSLYWRQILKVWLMNKKSFMSKNRRMECIWNNDEFVYQGNVVYFKEWAIKGITHLNDVMHNNCFITLREAERIIGSKPSLYLQYEVVKEAVRYYVRKQPQWNQDVHTDKVDILFNDKFLTSAKMFRIELTEIKYSTPCCEQFWNNKFGIRIEAEQWELARNTTGESRLRELHFKIMHNIYPTNILLHKMGISANNKCTYCTGEVDYLEHFFYDCKQIKSVWKCVEDMFYKMYGISMSVSMTEAILGIVTKPGYSKKMINFANHLILIAKMCVGKFRYGSPLVIQIMFERELRLRKLLTC